MVELVAQESAEAVPKGIYKAKLVREEVRKIKKGDEEIEYLDLIWEITEGEYAGQEIRESAPLYLSPKSKLGNIWKELTGETVVAGQKYKTENLIGVQAQLTVDVEEVEGKDGRKFKVNRIKAHLVDYEVKPVEQTKL